MTKPLAAYIDHTLLKPDATAEQIDQLVVQAKQYQFASVCINPYWVKRAFDALADSSVAVCTVIGFPLGANTTAIKAAEAQQALLDGADELDMVINIGELKAGHTSAVQADIAAVAQVVHAKGKLLKVIIECALLTDAQKVLACQLAEAAKADFVKTSTRFCQRRSHGA